MCVFLEKQETSSFLFNEATYPLIVTHATKPIKLAKLNYSDLDIKNISKYSEGSIYTIWEIPITEERIFDFKNTKILIDNLTEHITNLIIKQKIVYFVNIPVNYYNIFKNVYNCWSRAISDNSRMWKSRKRD